MKTITKNKRAYFDYEIETEYTAGIVLAGHEVKSLKMGQVNIQNTIISLQNREVWIL